MGCTLFSPSYELAPKLAARLEAGMRAGVGLTMDWVILGTNIVL